MTETKFAVISDIHYGSHNNIKETTKRLQTFANWLKNNDDELDSLIVLGDTIDKASENTKYNENLFKSIFDLFNTSDVSVSFLAGDQDVNALSRNIMEKYIGAAHGVRGKLIGLDTSWEQQTGPQGKVDNQIFKNYEFPQGGYIFSHHPLVPWNIEDNHWFSGTPEQAYSINKETIWENVIKKLNPRLVINGHIREYKSGLFNGIPCYSVRPFNKESHTKQTPSGYFYTVEDDGEKIEVTEHIAEENNIIHNTQKDIFDINQENDRTHTNIQEEN